MSFRVSVQPRLPYIDRQHPLSETEDGGNDKCLDDMFEGRYGRSDLTRWSASLTSTLEPYQGRHATRNVNRKGGKTSLSSPIRAPTIQTCNVPPYALLTSLYLDGRRLPERKVVVYLDPDDEDFSDPNGKVSFKHRWVQADDGTMTEHAWVFKEVFPSPHSRHERVTKCWYREP